MTSIGRRSPVQFKGPIQKSEVRDNWTVVLAYADEGQGPFLVDLSHKTRWDLQDKNIARFKPLGKEVPEIPGTCLLQDGILINRMNRTQAAIWHLLNAAPDLPAESVYTAVSDAAALDAARTLARMEGIIPALESAHAIAELIARAPRMRREELVILNLSGRGDKDMDILSRYLTQA